MVFVGVATKVLWEWLIEDGKDTRISVLRLSSLVTAALVAIVLAIWRSVVAQQQLDTAQRQSETAQQQFEIAQRGRLEERYQHAAEMLGRDQLPIRLAGIHALNQLARDHPEEFHIQVMQLFAAFVRHPLDYSGQPAGESADCRSAVVISPREDVQHIMVFLGLRTVCGQQRERAAGVVLDLRGADLRWVGFPADACLERVRLSGADLSGATGLTQEQLDDAMTDPSDPPDLTGCIDCKTRIPLRWTRQPIR